MIKKNWRVRVAGTPHLDFEMWESRQSRDQSPTTENLVIPTEAWRDPSRQTQRRDLQFSTFEVAPSGGCPHFLFALFEKKV
jgi:hypothetical protein